MEYLGLLVAAAVLVLLVVAAAPGVASSVTGGVQRAVCAVAGTACEASERAAAAPAPSDAGTVIEATGPGAKADALGGGAGLTGRTFDAT